MPQLTARDIHSAFLQARTEQWSLPARTWDELLPSERWTVYERMAALLNKKLTPPKQAQLLSEKEKEGN